ncbi:MAG: hypothetical protein FWE27_06270 [Defluviitaleaceae bacterium]|nr:hypothetical protein [Defluviitaleaceae bacterium]
MALLSGFWCRDRKDWLFLIGGLVFTVLSDSYLIVEQKHLSGVAVFCFVHVFYIFRAIDYKKWMLAAFSGFAVLWCVAVLVLQSVIILAGIYAFLFALNIIVNYKACRPKLNYYLVMAGLILFALCDVNVMLYNLPQYLGVSENFFPAALTLIWVFYLPSQVLLAVSAVRL